MFCWLEGAIVCRWRSFFGWIGEAIVFLECDLFLRVRSFFDEGWRMRSRFNDLLSL